MRISLCLLLAATCVLADESEDRRSKLPYVADAVGNTLPPPSNVPATVGSPVNLLTPDRYEFYTFDESGELVKRLMTLEEIQAIVAAGEETEGLVTFANDNQPTIAFNFSQPPYTKVHSVVTNVQNVLKAQMEAHKNKPLTQPTLDTPDVSDSWSLILPSIFGNTGVDIVPDKTSGTFTTPETETFELDHSVDNNYLSKEGSNQIISSSSTIIDELKEIPVTEKIIPTSEEPKTNPTTTSTSTTTTPKPKATTTTAKPSTTTTTTTTTIKPTTTTTRKPLSTTTSTIKPTTTTIKATTTKPTTTSTTARPRVTSTTTRRSTISSTSKPRTTTTINPTTKTIVRTTPKATTVKPNLTTKKHFTTTQKDNGNFTRIQVQTVANPAPTTEKATVKYEKINTFNPISTAAYVTERTTQKPIQKTKPAVSFASTTKRSVSTTTKPPSTTMKILPSITTYKPSFTMVTQPTEDLDNLNSTTVTTQSVSPSTTATVSSTEFISIGNKDYLLGKKPEMGIENNKDVKEEGSDQDIPLFDVAQSFSQIASDLGNYQPIPTTSDLLDTTKLNDMNIESKESVEIDIPADVEKDNEIKNSNVTEQQSDNFVKISTINPHDQNEKEGTEMKNTNSGSESKITMELFQKIEATTNLPTSTTIDPVLSESMDDLLSQVVNQTPQIVDPVRNSNNEMIVSTTENVAETTTDKINEVEIQYTTTEVYEKLKNISLTEAKESLSESITNSSTTTIENKVPLPVVEIINSKNTSKPFDHEKITDESTNSIKKSDTDQNFVQISISTNKNDSKSETTTTMSTLNSELNDHKPQEESEKLQEKEDTTSSKVNKKVPSDSSNKIKKEEPSTTTELLQTMTTDIPSNPPKKFENTLSQPVINKIVSVKNNEMNYMKDKTSEPLPKIDEFKKKIQKVNIDDKELANERNNSWKLISTVAPPKTNEIPKDKVKTEGQDVNDKDIVLEFSKENQGLEVTTKDLGDDIAQFTELCNELAFRYWHAMVENIDKKRSFVLSPYSITSMLAMMFMGARGATSGEMNEILKLDDMVTFNPHFTLKNISDSIETNPESGVIVSAFIRELFSDRSKGKILTFYKERAQQFYNGHVEEINFKLISDIIRRRTNLLVKRYSWGRIPEYMKSNTITMQPPLAAFSANIFQTDCSGSSVDGRDGEMYFVVSPNVRQRRLVPVPAVVYRSGFLAGYDPVLDATAAALGNTNSIISTLFLMPGQQGNVVHAEDLEALEKRLLDSNPTTPAWNRLLRTLLPRIGLELQIPRFSHKSTFNVSSTLRKMGLKDIFNAEHADLGGLNGPSKDLFLSDMIQSTSFVTCGEGVIGEQHQIEEYPENLGGPQRRRTSRWATGWDEPRDYQRAFHDPHDVGEAMHLPLHLRPRQARVPARNAQPARLKFDRPFLYFVRHNPSGMILYVGRYNPRLLP